MAKRIKDHKFISDKSMLHSVTEVSREEGIYLVTSGESGEVYTVKLRSGNPDRPISCTCPRQEWITQENGGVNGCSHVIAALRFRAYRVGYVIAVRPADDEAIKKLHRKTVRVLEGDNVIITARKTERIQ